MSEETNKSTVDTAKAEKPAVKPVVKPKKAEEAAKLAKSEEVVAEATITPAVESAPPAQIIGASGIDASQTPASPVVDEADSTEVTAQSDEEPITSEAGNDAEAPANPPAEASNEDANPPADPETGNDSEAPVPPVEVSNEEKLLEFDNWCWNNRSADEAERTAAYERIVG